MTSQQHKNQELSQYSSVNRERERAAKGILLEMQHLQTKLFFLALLAALPCPRQTLHCFANRYTKIWKLKSFEGVVQLNGTNGTCLAVLVFHTKDM